MLEVKSTRNCGCWDAAEDVRAAIAGELFDGVNGTTPELLAKKMTEMYWSRVCEDFAYAQSTRDHLGSVYAREQHDTTTRAA